MPATSPASNLEICFAEGERPHLFWVSRWLARAEGVGSGRPAGRTATRARYKVLSKRRADARLEVLVIEERSDGTRRTRAHESAGDERPSGWLDHWVSELAASLGTEFERFDLRAIVDESEWRDAVARLGWRRFADRHP